MHKALVHLRPGGVAVTDTLTIAQEFGRSHKNVLRTLDSLIADGTLNRLNFEPVEYPDAKGERRRMVELDERGALIAMPFIGGKNSRAGQARLVDAFLALRAAQAERKTGEWVQARVRAAVEYRVLADALTVRRLTEGKETKPHHYANEARLINYAFSGQFDHVDRNSLCKKDLNILHRLEARDTVLLLAGEPYAARKAALVDLASQLRVSCLLESGPQKKKALDRRESPGPCA